MMELNIEELKKLEKLSKKFPYGANIGEYYEEGALKLVTTDKIEIGPILDGKTNLAQEIIKAVKDKIKSQKTSEVVHDDFYYELLPILKNDDKVVSNFINEINGKSDHNLTEIVRRYRARKQIDEKLCHRHLWKIFVAHNMYSLSERNWNTRIKLSSTIVP